MAEYNSANRTDKDKVTYYIDPVVHRQLKIASATCGESMSALMEKAVRLYLEHSDLVECLGYGQTHRIHQCPECSAALVMRQGILSVIPQAQPTSAVLGTEIDHGEQNLIPC
jgi:hypothetical protein